MTIKSTLLNAGLVLGVGLMAIPSIGAPPMPAIFALPRDAAAYADFQSRLAWGDRVALAGLLIFFVCLGVKLLQTRRR